MYYGTIIFLILGGGYACAKLFYPKQGDLNGLKKLAPISSWVGVILIVWGVVSIIRILFRLSSFIEHFSTFTYLNTIYVAGIILVFITGLLLSLNFIKTKKQLSDQEFKTIEKKFKRFQIPLGILSVVIGILMLIALLNVPTVLKAG
jgi:formate-dependent nitrite reductase membrane component NrfD